MRQWKVGTISMGLLLILLGVLLLGNSIWDITISDFIVYAWPLILILLGVEVLLYSFLKKDGPIKFDFFSIIILLIALFFTFSLYSVQETGIINAIRGNINNNSYTFDINQTLAIPENVDEIIIDVPNGNIDIVGKDVNSAEVKGTIRVDAVNRDEADQLLGDIFTVKIVGNQAIIRIDEKRSIFNGNSFNNLLKANLEIIIPKDLEADIRLINGDIAASNLEGSGVIEGVNGKIAFDHAKGNYEVKTVNGEIRIEDLVGDLEAKTVNGEIDAINTIGSLNLGTTNGEITAASSQLAGDWDISTVNGEISIQIPSNADANIKAKSSLGKVKGNLPWVDKNVDEEINLGDNKEANLGNGKYEIDLDNEHGDIEVEIR